MVHALSSQFSIGAEGLVLHRPEPMERYIPVAPGIEVSVEPHEDRSWEKSFEASGYNRQGRMGFSLKKGFLVDTYF